MNRLTILTLIIYSIIIISCGKDDEPEVIPPQGYVVINDADTIRFNYLKATKDYFSSDADSFALSVIAGNYPGGDPTQTPYTYVTFYINTKVLVGFYNDKRCANCYNNPVLNILHTGIGNYSSEDCYIDPTTINTFSAELFYNKKADAETVIFNGSLCQPTSDTTFKTIKVKGVMQDAPFL